jgi:hypothetical protein
MKRLIFHLFSTAVAAAIIGITLKSFAAQLTLVPAQDASLFAGVKGNVPLTFQHDDSETVTSELTYRIYQASSATLAPLGEKIPIPHQSFPAAASLTVHIPFTPPDVRAITSFVLKVSSGDEELGSANITVVPPRVFARLNDLNLKKVFLLETDPSLGPLLEQAPLETTDDASAEVGLRIVRLPDPPAESDWKDRANKNSVPTLFIVGRGVTGAEKLLPVKAISRNDHRSVIVQDWFVPDLKENPLSQLRLLRAIQSLVKPEGELDPSKTKN